MKIRLLIMLLIITILQTACSSNNDFNKVCSYFSELEKMDNLKKISNEQRSEFIMNQIIDNLDKSSSARIAWEAIRAAVPTQRYEIFKEGAKSVIGSDWECISMQRLAATSGIEFDSNASN